MLPIPPPIGHGRTFPRKRRNVAEAIIRPDRLDSPERSLFSGNNV
jgi:hypothetical protein